MESLQQASPAGLSTRAKAVDVEVKPMAKPLLVSYDLDKPGQNYERLITRLKEHGAFRVLLSQWALKTTWTPVQLRDDLKSYIDANDRLLITEVADWASYNLMASDKFKEVAA